MINILNHLTIPYHFLSFLYLIIYIFYYILHNIILFFLPCYGRSGNFYSYSTKIKYNIHENNAGIMFVNSHVHTNIQHILFLYVM